MTKIIIALTVLFSSVAYSAPAQEWRCTGVDSLNGVRHSFEFLASDWDRSEGFTSELVVLKDSENTVIDLKKAESCEGVQGYFFPELEEFKVFEGLNEDSPLNAKILVSYACGESRLIGYCSQTF